MAVYETYVLYLACIVNILSTLFCGKLNFITSFYNIKFIYNFEKQISNYKFSILLYITI